MLRGNSFPRGKFCGEMIWQLMIGWFEDNLNLVKNELHKLHCTCFCPSVLSLSSCLSSLGSISVGHVAEACWTKRSTEGQVEQNILNEHDRIASAQTVHMSMIG